MAQATPLSQIRMVVMRSLQRMWRLRYHRFWFLITATASLGDSQISHYALVISKQTGGWANVTPLTTAVAALASPTTIPSAMTNAQLAAITSQNVTEATTNVKSVIAPLTTALNLPTTFDPLADKNFVANRTGADLLLDHLGVTIRSGAVSIANKMTVVSDVAGATAGVTISKGTAPTTVIAADKTDTAGLDALAKKFETCFKVPAGSRLSAKQVSGAVLAADCQAVVANDYLHNGQPFVNRWASALNSSDMDGATFSAPVVRLRLQAASSGVRERIAVNFNFKDKNSIGYTRPEVVEKQDNGAWILVGNKRAFNFYAEAALTYYDDVSTLGYNNTNFSRVDSGLRLSVDPRAAITNDGSVIYAALDMTQFSGFKDSVANGGAFTTLAGGLGANAKAIGCVVVKGPGLLVGSKWQGFHPNGVLLKRADASKLQDYMAVDSVVPNAARTAIDAAISAANGNFGAGKPIQFSYNNANINSETAPSNTSNNICTYNFGNRAGTSTTLTDTVNATVWESTQSSNTYVVEMAALGARKNVLTGVANDATIAGRDIAWNTGPRYARAAPTADIAKAFDNNPVITFEVFDTDGRLRAVMATRYLGDVPPAIMAKEFVDANRVSKFDVATLKRYLSFTDGAATVSANQNNVTAQWSTSGDAWGADRIMVYSEVQRAEVGTGTGGTNGIAKVTGTTKVSGLWTSDNDLATYLTAIPGNNFYWWNSGYAKDTVTTPCTGNLLISSTGVNVARKTLSLTDMAIDSAYFGLDQLNSACIAASGSTSTKAYVSRELGTRTYTDTNVRLYAYTANKAMRP